MLLLCFYRLIPRPLVVDTYVVDASSQTQQQQQQQEAGADAAGAARAAAAAGSSSNGGCAAGGELVSMFSFYTLPSSVLGHPEHKELRAAYMFYTGGCVQRGCCAVLCVPVGAAVGSCRKRG